jgi:hypothetical protein
VYVVLFYVDFNSNVLIKYSRECFRWSTYMGSALDRMYLFGVNMGQFSVSLGVEKLNESKCWYKNALSPPLSRICDFKNELNNIQLNIMNW